VNPSSPPVRRRTLLKVGVGAAGVGALGYALRRTSRRVDGTTVTGALEAPALAGAQAPWTIVYPRRVNPVQPVLPGAGQGGRVPVAVVLHDQGGDSAVVGELGLAEAVGRRVVGEQRSPFVLAAVSGGDRWWRARPDGTDAGALVLDQFLPRLADLGLAANDVHQIALVGYGAGGYGALRLAQVLQGRPAGPRVAAVVAVGPTLWPDAAAAARQDPRAFADAADFAAGDLRTAPAALAGVAVHVESGRDDPYLPGVRAVCGALRPPVPVTVVDGGHTASAWAGRADEVVRFVGDAFDRVPQI
jgi:hypothetical protein